uniref:Uncharacterized protein n=1 Tax=Arundo donax TaxID=35708 RepID=A0A0A9CM29_ARUDO
MLFLNSYAICSISFKGKDHVQMLLWSLYFSQRLEKLVLSSCVLILQVLPI